MASRTCWRCAHRPSVLYGISPLSISRFSTSSQLAKNPNSPAKKGPGGPTGPPQRGRKTLVISKKKKQTDNRKKPEEGERKALRKRIVLSNTNALDVPGLSEWQPASCCGSALHSLQGQVVTFNGETVDSMRALESFKTSQGWSYFRRPSSLIRPATIAIGDAIEHVSSRDAEKITWRRTLVGDRGTGKSVLLLQAHAMAIMKGWVVIHVPEAQDLTSATTAYSPLSTNEETTYAQRAYVAELLSRTAAANAAVLSTIQISLPHKLPFTLPPKATLQQLANLGARNPEASWEVFSALWAELEAPSGRPPVLLTLDGLAHVSRFSAYVSASMHHIHAHDLVLVRHFIDRLKGAVPLANGGIVLAADSMSNRPLTPALDLAISHALEADGKEQQSSFGELDPYKQVDTRSVQALQGVPALRVEPFSRAEARAMLEYYAHSGMLRSTVSDALVAEKWALAGGGVIRELEAATVRAGLV